ncbi:hypothetical protein [Streptomyces sp. NPDC056227]|uniref:hypothetical protein n=1 Tax=Streptomyces sp. NPDC056227 TaxID=3345753 RepID=UPI0035D72209
MAERLTFILDGHDRLTPAFRHAGESAEDFRRRINHVTTASGGDLRAFTQDANGRLRDLNGRFVSTGDAARRMQGDMNRLQGPMRGAAAATGEASAAGGSLTPVLAAVGVVVGGSLLPALGALVPMMAGAGLAAGTLKLGFAGVGDAVTAAGEDKKKYKEALKKLSPEARTFTKELVSLKREFGGIGKDIQKAMLPAFTRALKDAKPVIDIVGSGMVKLSKGFGEAAAGAGKLFKSGGFQRDLKTNLDLGMQFVRGLSGGFGKLVQSLLDFGAKSGPTLKSFTSGLSGLLGQGLPGMFKGLETGIGGSAKFLDGFFEMINKLLPAIGKFSGEVARAMGPMFGELFKTSGEVGKNALDGLGSAFKALTPVFKDFGFGLRAARDVMQILAPTIKDVSSAILGSFLPSFSRVDEARGPLQRLSEAITQNKGTIQETVRVLGNVFIDMAGTAIEYLPKVLGIFKVVSGGMVTALGGVLHASAEAFGWIPGIGDKLKAADKKFGAFKDSYISALGAAEAKANDFAAGAMPKLERGKLLLNINNWQSQVEAAKEKLKTLPPSKQAKVKGDISDLQRKIADAKAALAAIDGKSATTYLRTVYSPAGHTGPGGIPKFAKGGKPKAGWALVGEEGPELVRFKGGEQVYDHRSSMRMASGLDGQRTPAGAGQDAGRGLMAGLGAAASGVESAARRMAAAVTAGIRAELQIASPSKKTKALAADIGKGLIVGLTGSRDKIKDVSKDLAKDIWAAFDGSKDNRLVAMVNRETKKLLDAASKRDALIAKIKTAKDYAKTLTGGARQAANLDQLGMDPEEVTAGGIKAGLQQKLAKLKTFTSYINTLAKKGLNKSLLRQILDMGPEAGYAYASALVGADKATFNSINSLESQLNRGADKLGRSGADAMYDSGKNAGKGFLTGLQSQQDAIEKQMLKIAKGMQKAIKKALGIKSPSRVMAQLGRYSTEGLAAGLGERMPVLDRALGAVTDRVASAQPVIGRPAVVGGGASQPVQIQIDVHGAMDPVAVGRELQRVLLQLKRTQGVNVQLGVG